MTGGMGGMGGTAGGGTGGGKRPGWAVPLGIVAAVILLAGVFAVGLALGGTRLGGDRGRAGAGETNAIDGAGPGGGNAAPAVVAGTSRRASLRGEARSLEVSGRVIDLGNIALRGSDLQIPFHGRVVDGGGTDRGLGTLTVRGSTATITGEVAFEVAALTVTPREARLPQEPLFADHSVAIAGPATVAGETLEFAANDGGRPVPIPGPARLEPAGNGTSGPISGNGVTWADPPADLHVVQPDLDHAAVSWAGSGSISVEGIDPISHEFLGVTADSLDVRVQRGERVAVSGEALVTQVYADGLPRLATEASMELISASVTVRAGGRGNFVWAPHNEGGAFTMAITRIRAGNDGGRWVNLELATLPPMFGGEPRPPRGGDTSELGKRGSGFPLIGGRAHAISSVLPPGSADRRDMTFDVPDGTPAGPTTIVLIIEGNFEPLTVEIPVTIT